MSTVASLTAYAEQAACLLNKQELLELKGHLAASENDCLEYYLEAYENASLEYEKACTAFIAQHELISTLPIKDRLATYEALQTIYNKAIKSRDVICQPPVVCG